MNFIVDEKRISNLFREMGSPKEPTVVKAFLLMYEGELEEFLAKSVRRFLGEKTREVKA